MRFLIAKPGEPWVNRLVDPAGIDPREYSQRMRVSASRALMLDQAAEVRWQPFLIPWWIAIFDNRLVHLKAINLVGLSPATQIEDAPDVAYYQRIFSEAWEQGEAVTAPGLVASSTPNPSALRVFLCHASGDKPLVRVLHQRLLADGVSPWLDEENLVPGQHWEHEISRAIAQSDVVVVCVSANSTGKRGFIQRELAVALRVASEVPRDSIFLIPARLEPCDVPDELRHLHWVDLFDPKGYALLLRALRVARQPSVKG